MILPRIVITAGDPAGIGPEIIAKALSRPALSRVCRPVVIGDSRVFARYGIVPSSLPASFINIATPGLTNMVPGRISVATGRASFRYIEKAVHLIAAGHADALVTAPISKAAINCAGIHYAGHTELLAALTATKNCAMLMAAGKLRVVMVTRHIPLIETGKKITKKTIIDTTFLLNDFLKTSARINTPRIAVCALNPHAGEAGLLGREEGSVILPAVEELRHSGIDVVGPLPGDSAWQKIKRGEFDLLVAMYHDQAMTGLKCLAPEKIVNITVGLPFPRTSPGHGTAFEIAGADKADCRPMIEAIRSAAGLCR